MTACKEFKCPYSVASRRHVKEKRWPEMYRTKMGSEIRSTYFVLFKQTTKLLFSLFFCSSCYCFVRLLIYAPGLRSFASSVSLRHHNILLRDYTSSYSLICSFIRFCLVPYEIVGRNSSVDIAIRYGLDGPGIESRWERDLPHQSTPILGLTQPPIQWVSGLFLGGKAPEVRRWPPTLTYRRS